MHKIYNNYDSQSLFPELQFTTKDNVLKNYNFLESNISKWNKLSYFSFDFDNINEFESHQIQEIIFINKLFLNCKNDTVTNYMLNKLQKPYSYNFEEIYFDIFDDEWKELPVETNISDYSFDEILNELLDDCKEEEKIEVISDYITELSSRLKE
jgi:hypothetical protein